MKRELLFTLYLLFSLLVTLEVSGENQLSVNFKLIPQGPTSASLIVIGDSLTYQIDLNNLNNETFEDDLIIQIYDSKEKVYERPPEKITIRPLSNFTFIPYINEKEVDSIHLESTGDYKILIKSSPQTKFLRIFNLTEKRFEKTYYINNGYFYNYGTIGYPFVSISRLEHAQILINEQTTKTNIESIKFMGISTGILVIATIAMVLLAFFNLMVSIMKWKRLPIMIRILFIFLLFWAISKMVGMVAEISQGFA